MMLQLGVGITCKELKDLGERCRELSKSSVENSPKHKLLLAISRDTEALSGMIRTRTGDEI